VHPTLAKRPKIVKAGDRVQVWRTPILKPEKLQRLQACLQEAASILYEETPSEGLRDLERKTSCFLRQH